MEVTTDTFLQIKLLNFLDDIKLCQLSIKKYKIFLTHYQNFQNGFYCHICINTCTINNFSVVSVVNLNIILLQLLQLLLICDNQHKIPCQIFRHMRPQSI